MNKQSTFKKYATLLLLACAPAFIFTLPYIRESFYVPIQTAMNLTNAQMGSLTAWYAIVATPAYLFGGVVADKFPPRIMLTFSLVSTGLLGFWFSTFPGYEVSRIIFALMGLTTVLTFWSSVIKAVRMLGTPEEQGRLYGLQEGLRGFLNAALVFAMAFVYGQFANGVDGAAWTIRFCAALLIILGIIGFFMLAKGNDDEKSEPIKDLLLGMVKCFKIPRVWLLVGIVFTAYSVYALMSYVNTYAVTFCGLSETDAANLGGIRYCMQGLGGIAGGFLADKIHSRLKVIGGAGILLALSYGAFFVIPAEASALAAVLVNFMIGVMLVYTIRSLYFSTIGEANIDMRITGRVSGILSTLGYLPDVFLLTLTGSWIDSYAGTTGYMMVFGYAAAMGILCTIIAFVLLKVIKKSGDKVITVDEAGAKSIE